MLRALKQWLASRGGVPDAHRQALQDWCMQRQFSLEPGARAGGFAVRGRLGAAGWRLEWGAPQRLYVRGRGELVLQSELRLAPELHLMVLDRLLQRRLERAVLDQIAGADDGRVDPQMPPEMRWLVTFPRLDTQQAGWPDGFEAVASHPDWLLDWTGGALAQALAQAPAQGHTPWLLTIGAGCLELRAGLDDPAPQRLEAWLGFFECAMREARRVQTETGEAGEPTTLPGMWAVARDDSGPNERI
jgi:hypothetical protein